MFDGSGFEQDTYTIIRARDKSDWIGAYNPYAICTWEYLEDVAGFDGPTMVLHEMSHAIEIWERKKDRTKLLKKNFGYVRESDKTFTAKQFEVETWVLGLQSFLGRKLFCYCVLGEDTRRKILNSFVHDDGLFAMSELEFYQSIRHKRFDHMEKGLDYYRKSWQDLCAYVKANRPPESEVDPLRVLMGLVT